MKFKVGQKVVCVNDDETILVAKDSVYTVERISEDLLFLVEMQKDAPRHGMYMSRFRPVQ